MQLDRCFLRDIESTLRFEYQMGGVTTIWSYVGEQRVLPTSVVAQISRGGVWVTGENKPPVVLGDGDMFCLAPGVRHQLANRFEGSSVSRWAHFNVFVFGSVDFMTLLDMPPVFRGEMAHEVGDICEELNRLHTLETPDLRDVVQRQSLGLRLASLIVGSSSMDIKAQKMLPYLERLAPVLGYIHQNLTHPMTREELANELHLSPSRFYALFKEALGVSPTDYVQSLRLQHAQRLLLNSDISVAEVGAGSGYPDEFHFSRLFRKRFGISPLQYRKNITKNLHG